MPTDSEATNIAPGPIEANTVSAEEYARVFDGAARRASSRPSRRDLAAQALALQDAGRYARRSGATRRRRPSRVVGDDDREQVSATGQYPFSAICHLDITAGDGVHMLGTGWFIGPRLVMTAGHCVYLHRRGGWVRSIKIVPGQPRTGTQPFASLTSTRFKTVAGWRTSADGRFDYGAIVVDGADVARQTGTLGVRALDDASLLGNNLVVTGYPDDKSPPGSMWFHGQRARSVDGRKIFYDIDTQGGQSGAPIWLNRNGTWIVGGIHTGAISSNNSGVRVNREMIGNIRSWLRL